LSINVTTGELLDIERVMSSSERGGWKRAEFQYLAGRLLYIKSGSEGGHWKSACLTGNSLVAYPTMVEGETVMPGGEIQVVVRTF
jgi:hypothetical protein